MKYSDGYSHKKYWHHSRDFEKTSTNEINILMGIPYHNNNSGSLTERQLRNKLR